jgi:hypothetical protein
MSGFPSWNAVWPLVKKPNARDVHRRKRKKKTDENVNKVRELVHDNRRITTGEIATVLRISYMVLNNTEGSQIIFANSEIYYEIISQNIISKLSDVRLKVSKFWMKGCKAVAMIFRQEHCSQGRKFALGFDENKRVKLIVRCQRNLECTHLLSHPFTRFTNSSARHVCVKRKLPLL